MNSFDHLVCVDEEAGELIIYRVDPKGVKTLFTKTTLPKGRGWDPDVEKFAKLLGENLLMDSPSLRRILEL